MSLLGMKAHVGTVREGSEEDCPACQRHVNPPPGHQGVFCDAHSLVTGFRWAVVVRGETVKGTAKTREKAWAAVQKAYANAA